MFVVTGATGNVGRQLVEELARRGLPTRALVRNPSTSLPAGVDVVLGDLTQPDSARPAFDNADAVFLLPGYPGLAQTARSAGVKRIVQLSGGSAGSSDLSNAITRYMKASEAEMRESGLEWTAIRPTAFMSNVLRWAPQLEGGDVIRVSFPDVPVACVDPGDVAAVAATAMVEDGHTFMIYRPTGPHALLPHEQVRMLGEAIGRELRAQAMSNGEARRAMLAHTPAPYVAAFFDFYTNGSLDETTVRTTVEDVIGRRPRTFPEWLADNRHRLPHADGASLEARRDV